MKKPINELPYSKSKATRNNIRDRSKHKPTNEPEKILQRQVEEYLEYLPVEYIRIPDSVYYTLFGPQSGLSSRDKAFVAKYLKGLKDLIVLKPLDNGYALALVLELKTAKGKVSQGQKNKHKLLTTHVKRSFDDARELIDDFVNNAK